MSIIAILATLLLTAISATAQQTHRITYVAEFQIRWGQGSEHIGLTRKYDKPMLDGLFADGTVLDWGEDVAIMKREGIATHRVWVSTPDYTSMEKVIAGFNRMQTPQEDVARYLEVANLSKLHERYFRSILFSGPRVSPARSLTIYSVVKVNTGKDDDWLALFERHRKPLLDKWLAEGVVHSYGVNVEDLHTESLGGRWIWVTVTNLAQADTILAEFDRAATDPAFAALTDLSAHRDYVYRKVLAAGPQ